MNLDRLSAGLIASALVLASACPLSADTGPNWLPLGPAPVAPSAAIGVEGTLSPPIAGRATVLAVNPKNRYNIWLGTASGGLWVTNNVHVGGLEAGGVKADPAAGNFDRNWRPRWFPHNAFESLSIGAVVLDPATCDASGCLGGYVGTGENSLRRDTYYGNGVYHVAWSADEFGGHWSWGRLDTTQQFKYGNTAALVLDGNELFVALSAGNTTTAVYASVKAPRPAAGYGVHRRDGAGNWTRVFETPSNGRERWADLLLPTDLEKIPGTADSFLLGVHNDGIFKTTNRGQTWCALNPGSRLVTASQNGSIATPITDCSAGTGLPAAGSFDHVEIAAESGSVLYAMFGNCPSGYTASTQGATSVCDGRRPSFFKSTNGGTGWSSPGAIDADPFGDGRFHYSRYTHALWAAGGGQVLWGGLHPFVLKTSSGFSQDNIQPGSLHWDVHDLKGWGGWDSGGDVFYTACDGGFYASFNGSWKPGNDSLITTAFVGIALDYEDEPGDGFPRTTAILGGLQDNSNAAYNGSPVWQIWGPVGDGGEALIQTPTITFDSIQNNAIRRIPGFSGFSTSINGTRINGEEDAPFYSPLVQHEQTKRLFVATDVVSVREGLPDLWTTGMSAPTAVRISPVLGTDGHDFPPIETDRDWITALAVAPSHGWRVYAGLYSGKLWRSTTSASQQPTTAAADWTRADSGLPAGVISSIAVHPTEHRKLWVAFSDFIDQTVWYSDDEGASWHQRSSGLPAREPVKVIKVDPDSPAKLWLGTDTGVYHSIDGGLTWEARKANLPPVPVFDLEIDRHTKRIFAATHGRGVWMNTDQGPLLTTFEGWTDEGIWDIPIYGTGFTCTRAGGCDCTVDVEREDGTVCATGTRDAMNRRVFIAQGDHLLRTDDIGSCTRCEGKPVVFACFNGDCVGPTPLNTCNAGGHRVSAVKVRCQDNPVATGSVAGSCPEQSNPPSDLFEVTPALNVPGGGGGGGGAAPLAVSSPAGPVTLVLTPTVMASPPNGGDHALCTALAELGPADAEPQLKLVAAVNASASCQAAGVRASVVQELVSQGEDSPKRRDQRLALSAPGVKGAQLILAIGVPPGQAEGSCFTMSRLGVYLANQIAVTQLRFPTAPGGAAGGHVAVTEISPVGVCELRVETHAGETSLQIAQAVAGAFQAPGVPSPATCPESNNPRDIVQDGPSVVAVLPTALRVCVEDAGIGFGFGPHGVSAEPPQIQIPGDVSLPGACAGAASTAILNVCNSGKGDLLVNPILSSSPQVAVTTPSSGYPVVISHDFCFPFQVRFAPVSGGGVTATLTVVSNDPLHPIVQVKAAGTGLVPRIAVTGSTDFGVTSAWSPAEKTVEVCNSGGCALQVTSASVGCADFILVGNPFPAPVAPGSCLGLTVGFTPTLPGLRRCQLTVASDDPGAPIVVRDLTARTPPALLVRVGVAQPHGGLSHSARQGSAFELGFRYPVRPRWAWEVDLGISRLDGRPAPDVRIPSFSAQARYTINPASSLRVFLAAGPSVHHFEPGDFELGGDLALGADFSLGRRFALEAQYRYRWAWTSTPDVEYSQILLGLSTSF